MFPVLPVVCLSFARLAPLRETAFLLAGVGEKKAWWAILDSNQWPHGCDPCALTN